MFHLNNQSRSSALPSPKAKVSSLGRGKATKPTMPKNSDILFSLKAINLMPGLGDSTRRVAGAIIDHFNKKTGQCDPSIERLVTLLEINRATVLRATDRLHELELISKISHGGHFHCCAYQPNWDNFRKFVVEWDALMKAVRARVSLDRQMHLQERSVQQEPAEQGVELPINVADVRPPTSQDCEPEGRSAATQTSPINQSKKPVETVQGETPPPLSGKVASRQPVRSRFERPREQLNLLLPINGGKSTSHLAAAHAAAEKRWHDDMKGLSEWRYAKIAEWMTTDSQAATTEAEMACRGGGLNFIRYSMSREDLW